MDKVLWIAMFLVAIQASNSYILLTANIDDLRNIGRRVVQSPIGGQVTNIVRRAFDVFNSNLGRKRATMRAGDDDIILAYQPDDNMLRRQEDSVRRRNSDDVRDESDEIRRSNENENDETFSALGKSASVYLQKIKKIFEKA